jgi:hypothetical protein
MVTGSVTIKHKRFYVCLNIHPDDGERIKKWFPTGLPERGNKRNADEIADTLRSLFNRDGTLVQKSAKCYSATISFNGWSD